MARSSALPRLSASFPNEASIIRLVGAILLEQNDEWAVQRARYITLESITPVSDEQLMGRAGSASYVDGCRGMGQARMLAEKLLPPPLQAYTRQPNT